MTAPLLIHRDPEADWLCAFELGVVEDGQPERNWHVISEHCRLLYSEPGGRLLGFDARAVSKLDLDALEAEELFEGPRFDVPVFGAARRHYRRDLPGWLQLPRRRAHARHRVFPVGGVRRRGDLDEAERLWRLCLEAGGLEAHYGLGYTLLDLERPHDAYRHLRYYTEITPANAWAWCYRGRAAEAIGENDEARNCYERAVELAPAGEDATDAAERLDSL